MESEMLPTKDPEAPSCRPSTARNSTPTMYELLNRASARYARSALYRAMNPRRAHLYCVGTAKSGTHSITALFDGSLRSSHEVESELVMDVIFDIAEGKMTRDELTRFVRKRDTRLWLDVDSSQLNYFLLNILVEAFKDAKFILTIRDCYSWLDSFINHQLSRGASENWKRLRDLRFRSDQLRHVREEEILKEHGLYTLDGYFSYWTKHNKHVLETVPPERLLVIRTHELTQAAMRIAAFAGLPAEGVNLERSHAFKTQEKFYLLSRIEPRFLEGKVDQYCRDLMNEYFPTATVQSVLPERKLKSSHDADIF